MTKNQISYEIDKHEHKVYYSKNVEDNLVNDIQSLHSDRKVLFIYDKNISKKFILNIKTKLKLTGNLIFFKKVDGQKKNKNLKTLLSLFDELVKNKFTKNSVIISCGGGVVGDLSGLLSSLYLRGTIYFHIPSTMTAIVDSCIGGKTGINHKGIINSFGNYYHPKRVYISQKIIEELPEREYFSGFAEIIKCGLIGNRNIIRILQKDKFLFKKKKINTISKVILETLKTKIKFFKDDVREQNQRLILNFGHTFAHAIEMATDKHFKNDYLRHGEAVGLGMLCEIMMSQNTNRKNNSNNVYYMTKQLLKKYNLPTKLKIPNKLNRKKYSEIYEGVFLDKKIKNKYPRFISLKKICSPKIEEIKDFGALNDSIYKITQN